MKKTILFVLACLLCVGCVSLKKYRALEADYQRCGEYERAYEQMKRIEQCEKMNEK
jgi:hypothetical protein